MKLMDPVISWAKENSDTAFMIPDVNEGDEIMLSDIWDGYPCGATQTPDSYIDYSVDESADLRINFDVIEWGADDCGEDTKIKIETIEMV